MKGNARHTLRLLVCICLLSATIFCASGAAAGPFLTIAHRGTGPDGAVPENTLPAIERAIRDGADLIELDIRLTADGVPVALHDATLERTTDCAGCVRSLDLADLKSCRVVGPDGRVFEDVTVPTLAEALEQIDGRAGVNIEIKPDCCDQGDADRLVETVVRTVEGAPAPTRLIVSSFSDDIVARVEALRPAWQTALLVGRGDVRRGLQTAARRGLDGLCANHRGLSADVLKQARELGLFVLAWTVNDPTRIGQLVTAGVDGVVTDRPELARDVLGTFDIRQSEPVDDDEDADEPGGMLDGDDDEDDADPGDLVGCGDPPDRYARY